MADRTHQSTSFIYLSRFQFRPFIQETGMVLIEKMLNKINDYNINILDKGFTKKTEH